jgi:putative transposase
LDEVFVKVNGKLCYLWRAVDHEGEVLEAVGTEKRDKAAALKLLKRIIRNTGLLAASSPMGFGHIRRR